MNKVLCYAFKDENGNLVQAQEVKKKRKAKRSNFFMGDNDAIMDLALKYDLDRIDYRVLLYLFGNMDWDNNIMITVNYLAEVFKAQPSAISRSLKNMVTQGIISRGKINGQSCIHIEEHIAVKGTKDED